MMRSAFIKKCQLIGTYFLNCHRRSTDINIISLKISRFSPAFVFRCYGSAKDKEKQIKTSLSGEKVAFDESSLRKQILDSVNYLRQEFSNLRIGRASTSILERVNVSMDGKNVPLFQVAQVHLRDSQTMTVSCLDTNTLQLVEKAIRNAQLGLNPLLEGKVLKIPIAKTTKEDRDQLAKSVTAACERTKIGVRNHRQQALKMIKTWAEAGTSKDDVRMAEKAVQELVDKTITEIDLMGKNKSKEIMTL